MSTPEWTEYLREEMEKIKARERLIAAAPDLLRALKLLVVAATDLEWESHALDVARIAIARAEGRS